jgi:hypothetical protein
MIKNDKKMVKMIKMINKSTHVVPLKNIIKKVQHVLLGRNMRTFQDVFYHFLSFFLNFFTIVLVNKKHFLQVLYFLISNIPIFHYKKYIHLFKK